MTPLVLLHGFMGRGVDWDAVRSHLDVSAPVRAPDLPGHGDAVDLPDHAYTMDGATAHVLQSVSGDGPVDVVGYSMGGRLALHLALSHPERVRRLVLVSASPGLRTSDDRAVRRALDAERAANLELDPGGFVNRWYRTPLFGLMPDLRHQLTADRVHHTDAAELARSLRGMGTGRQPSHWDALAGISAPTLAVAGARDTKFVDHATAMAAAGPAIEARIVPDASHILPAEAPAALAHLLTDFLS